MTWSERSGEQLARLESISHFCLSRFSMQIRPMSCSSSPRGARSGQRWSGARVKGSLPRGARSNQTGGHALAAHLPGRRRPAIATFVFKRARPIPSLRHWPDMDTDGDTPLVMLLFADPPPTMQDVLGHRGAVPGDPRRRTECGGGQDLGENRLFLDDVVHTDGWSAWHRPGPSPHTVISQGCRPIGERFIVTKAEHNVIQEPGGRPALHCLQTASSAS